MTEDKFILDTEGLYPFQREAVEALMKANTVSIDVEGNEPRLYTLDGKSRSLAVYAEFFRAQLLVSHRPELVKQLQEADYTGVEARLLATYDTYFGPDMILVDEVHNAYSLVDYKTRYIPITPEDLKPIYCVREDTPKKDNAPWRRIPHKRGRMKMRRKR